MEDLLANGIHATTGLPLLAGLTLDDIGRIARGQKLDPTTLAELYGQSRRKSKGQNRAPVEGVDPENLAEAGWGVVFAADSEAEQQALAPLLALRREQAGDRYREFTGATAFQPGESKQSFLKARGVASTGPVEVSKMPYYLLLVGSPEAIPFEFQYSLDVQYAVGRIHFDKIEDYASYAAAVVAAETGSVTVAPRAAFVGVKNRNDRSTPISMQQLVQPLAAFLKADQTNWTVESLIEEAAHKKNLLELLARKHPPALLFTASHGLGYSCGDPLQHRYQGALLMQDFEFGSGPVSLHQCFSADDADQLKTPGMIAFHFACFAAGTPAQNNFYGYAHGQPGETQNLAQTSFLSAVPKRLLANGALAAVGHVDTAFATTFSRGASTSAYQSALKKLAEGGRIGLAMDSFNLRHAELSVGLTLTIDEEKRARPAETTDLAIRWLENNDARNFIILGDPAVKLPLALEPAIESAELTRQILESEQELARMKMKLKKLSK